MKSFKNTLATSILSAAILGVAGGCQNDEPVAEPSQSTKQGPGQMKTPAGMEKPQPTGTSGAAVKPSDSTKQGSGQMKTPAGMEKPTVDSSLPKPAATDLTHEITADSPYYASSPAQSKPADGTLKAGTKVLLIMPSGSYAQVWAENGVKGYVPTDNIKALK